MKYKNIILTLTLFFVSLCAQAQEWRGFIELTAGGSPMVYKLAYQDYIIRQAKNPLVFGLNYTMGVRVTPNIYAGVGIGGYTSMFYHLDRYLSDAFPSIRIPVFANVRWIPDNSKKVKPFADLKIGYQMGVDLDQNKLYAASNNHGNSTFYARHKNGIYLQPGAGYRFGHENAFNLGVAYNVFMGFNFDEVNKNIPDLPIIERITKNYGVLMLTFGADF